MMAAARVRGADIVARTLAVYDELFNDRATGKALANA